MLQHMAPTMVVVYILLVFFPSFALSDHEPVVYTDPDKVATFLELRDVFVHSQFSGINIRMKANDALRHAEQLYDNLAPFLVDDIATNDKRAHFIMLLRKSPYYHPLARELHRMHIQKENLELFLKSDYGHHNPHAFSQSGIHDNVNKSFRKKRDLYGIASILGQIFNGIVSLFSASSVSNVQSAVQNLAVRHERLRNHTAKFEADITHYLQAALAAAQEEHRQRLLHEALIGFAFNAQAAIAYIHKELALLSQLISPLSNQYISTELISFKQAGIFLEAVKNKAAEIGLTSLAKNFHDLYHCTKTIYLHDSEIPNQKDVSILLSCPVVDVNQKLTGALYKDLPFQQWSKDLQRPVSYRWDQKSALIAFENGIYPNIRSFSIPEDQISSACVPYADALLCRAALSDEDHSCAVSLAFGSTANCTLTEFSGKFPSEWVADTLFTFSDKPQTIYSECPNETPRTTKTVGLVIWPHYDVCTIIVDNKYFYPRAQSSHLLFTMEAGTLRLVDPPTPHLPLPDPPADPMLMSEELEHDLKDLNTSRLKESDLKPMPNPPSSSFPHSSIVNFSLSGFAVLSALILFALYGVAIYRRGRQNRRNPPPVSFHVHREESEQVSIQQNIEDNVQSQDVRT